MSRVRRAATASVVGGLCAAALGVVPVSVARASCIAPQLAVGAVPTANSAPASGPVTVRRGSTTTVGGLLFSDGCDDVIERRGSGCGRQHEVHPETEEPSRQVPLTLVQGGRTWPLGYADAGDVKSLYAVTWSVRVPTEVHLGVATLRAGLARLDVVVTP